MTLLAAFQCLLHRYTRHDDIAVGSLIANRNQIEIERLIGMFANALILRTDLSGDPTFSEVLRRVRQVTLDAYRNQDLPIEEVLRALQVARRADGNPLFRVMFLLQNASSRRHASSGLSRGDRCRSGVARSDLLLELIDEDDRLSGWLEYSTDLFEAARSSAWQRISECCWSRSSPIPRSASRACRCCRGRTQAAAGAGPGVPANSPRTALSANVSTARSRRTPDAIAVSDGRTSLSYRDLRAAAAAARWLSREASAPMTWSSCLPSAASTCSPP